MSHLIEAPSETAAEDAVQSLLDSFARGERTEAQLTSGLMGICKRQHDATWHALSLLDRMHRRGTLSVDLFRALKTELNTIVFSATGKHQAHRPRAAEIKPAQLQPANSTSFQSASYHSTSNQATSNQASRSAVLHDRYELREPLAIGRVTTTFKALDRQRESWPESQRCVAIRLLNEQQADWQAIAALQHEYAHLRLIAHPNIAKALELNESSGASYIVAELPAGESLSRIAERIAPRRLPLAKALTIVREIGVALANAHAHGIVHGNLYSGNVFVTPSGDVRVFDFALADFWLDATSGSDDTHSAPIASIPRRYCSSQRLQASIAQVSDDIYSLACIAYELLCGELPNVASLHCGARHRPRHAQRLSVRQWRALQTGLAVDRQQRTMTVPMWLAELDLEQSAIRLPALVDLESDVVRNDRRGFLNWLRP